MAMVFIQRVVWAARAEFGKLVHIRVCHYPRLVPGMRHLDRSAHAPVSTATTMTLWKRSDLTLQCKTGR